MPTTSANLKLRTNSSMDIDLQNNLNILDNAIGALQTATLSSGTVTVANTSALSTDVILVTRTLANGASGTLGHLYYSISAGTSYTFASSSVTDGSTIAYQVIKATPANLTSVGKPATPATVPTSY